MASVTTLTVEQRFQLTLSAIRLEKALEALTLTNNPTAGLVAVADAAVTDIKSKLSTL
ncbi:hypothetical protein HOR51_gp55 [Ralstonia phage phiAp1]|uniref:Uncharacterized protein n=1 Tax=Ralstonia phage phiAp1 TaxID=2783867 RepID=A0A1L7DS88_9CAUD|nr:hypothetical protein HOR51_gp55 [Ralstonia phage phiAp1]APU03196.1 hypothetical protein phiAp1_55 [Ralstonia phage phiAp1]